MVALNLTNENGNGDGANHVAANSSGEFNSWLHYLLQSVDQIAIRLKAVDRKGIRSLMALKSTLLDQLVIASTCDARIHAKYVWKKNSVLFVVVSIFDSHSKTYKIPYRTLGIGASQALRKQLGAPN